MILQVIDSIPECDVSVSKLLGFETSRFRNFSVSKLLFSSLRWEEHIPLMGRSYSADGKIIFRWWEEHIPPMGRTYSANGKNIFRWWEEHILLMGRRAKSADRMTKIHYWEEHRGRSKRPEHYCVIAVVLIHIQGTCSVYCPLMLNIYPLFVHYWSCTFIAGI